MSNDDEIVFTYEHLSIIHGIPAEQIQEAYIAERSHFTEGVDTLLLGGGTRVFTLRGFIKMAKVLDTPAAWEIWRRFVEAVREKGGAPWRFGQD